MNKQCIICSNKGIYKCPTCLIFYCSTACCKKHRENNCQVLKDAAENEENNQCSTEKQDLVSRGSSDFVSNEQLAKLGSSEELKNILQNPHLQNLLTTVDNADNAEEIMQKAMQEPLFVEFADTCLKVIEPEMAPDNNDVNMT